MATTNSELILNFFKMNFGKEFTKQEVAAQLGVSLAAVTGTVNGLVKKGYITERIEEVEVEPATADKAEKTKKIRHETLTEAGLTYDPAAEKAAKDAAKAATKIAF